MAPLTSDTRAARFDARRLRLESESHEVSVRGNLACSRQRLGRAQVETSKARALRLEPQPSPWSELRWTESYEALDLTLVPLR